MLEMRLFLIWELCSVMFVSEAFISRSFRGKTLFFPSDPEYRASHRWFEQRLDHFNPSHGSSWWQRYWYESNGFKDDSDDPVFLLIGGESTSSFETMKHSIMMDYAQKHRALSFHLEHRYYGKSQPVEDLSVENLRYLSSQQALADIVNFIQGMNDMFQLTSRNKWIVFGCSYAGSLAAWARMKYPHMIHAAISSSAPLSTEADFTGYFQVVRSVLESSSEQCADNVHRTFLTISEMLDANEGAALLSEEYGMCSVVNATDSNDVTFFVDYLAHVLVDAVQYNRKHCVYDLTCVDAVCSFMTDESLGSFVDRYAALFKVLANLPSGCAHSNYSSTTEALRDQTFTQESFDRQWMYQLCTEFGFFPTSSARHHLLGPLIKFQYFVNWCQAVFGKKFDEELILDGMKRNQLEYGGTGIDVNRAAFVQGTADPWHVLGKNGSGNPGAPVITIENGSHCASMISTSHQDTPGVTSAIEHVGKVLQGWVRE